MSDDREKKSWRDIDRGRDRSAHRKDPRPEPGAGGARRERSQKSYRAALDRAFEIGALGKLLGSTEPRPPEGESRLRLLAAIRDANTSDEVSAAVDRALAAGPLPDEAEVWARVVEHNDLDRVREALRKLPALLKAQPLKRARTLKARLRYLEEVAGDEELRREAAALRARLPA
jgi:hypothetical protein